MPVAVYDGCGSVAFVYWLRLKQFVVPMKAQSHLWLWHFGNYLEYGDAWWSYLRHSCVFVCNERYSHSATGSVRKGIGILPHSSPLPSKPRYVLPWWCMSRDGPASGQNILHTINLFGSHKNLGFFVIHGQSRILVGHPALSLFMTILKF